MSAISSSIPQSIRDISSKLAAGLNKLGSSLDGWDKAGSLIVSGVALVILIDGKEGHEGLKTLSEDFENFQMMLNSSKWTANIDDIAKWFKDDTREWTDIATALYPANFSGKKFLATARNVIFAGVSLLSLNEYAARIQLFTFARVISPIEGVNFSIGKVAGVAAMPLKLFMLCSAFAVMIIENGIKLVDLWGQHQKLKNKVELLSFDPNATGKTGTTQADVTSRAKVINAKIANRLNVDVSEVTGAHAEKFKKRLGAVRLGAVNDQENLEVKESAVVDPVHYAKIVQRAAIAKLLEKAKENLDSDETVEILRSVKKLINMSDADFKAQKLNDQYAPRQSKINQDAIGATLVVLSMAIKIATLGTFVGQAYGTMEVLRSFFKTESEIAIKVVLEAVKLVGALLGATKFLVFDEAITETKPAAFKAVVKAA
jgi:hypothetical protein